MVWADRAPHQGAVVQTKVDKGFSYVAGKLTSETGIWHWRAGHSMVVNVLSAAFASIIGNIRILLELSLLNGVYRKHLQSFLLKNS